MGAFVNCKDIVTLNELIKSGSSLFHKIQSLPQLTAFTQKITDY